ncbi:MAG: ATP-grasp domain-containing protein [Planctomycetaceae bacterium]|nr:ATP-grasp domain-containing protein [Planctomycetaceae bacterium]
MNSPLLIVGASVRAAAESASQAGFQPFAIDLFNDTDLTHLGPCSLSENYPDDLPALAAEFASMPFLYTGAVENHPSIITELSKTRELLGNTAENIQKLRDPFQLRDLLESHSFPTAELREADDPPGNFFGWLIKPYQSGHGLQIRPASENIHPEREYYQRLISGISIGALFLANGTECRLIGLHQQLTGLHPDPKHSFLFSGALAPYVLPERATETIVEIGQLICRTTGLRGLFGCDFIFREVPYLLEVNPRYTAATELWERLLKRPLIADHVIACREGTLPEREETIDRDGPSQLKLILYVPQSTQIPPKLTHCVEDIPEALLADLPTAGHQIAPGNPLCTLLVEGPTPGQCRDVLQLAWDRIAVICQWDPVYSRSMLENTIERIAPKYP